MQRVGCFGFFLKKLQFKSELIQWEFLLLATKSALSKRFLFSRLAVWASSSIAHLNLIKSLKSAYFHPHNITHFCPLITAARIITRTSSLGHIPVKLTIEYKILLYTFKHIQNRVFSNVRCSPYHHPIKLIQILCLHPPQHTRLKIHLFTKAYSSITFSYYILWHNLIFPPATQVIQLNSPIQVFRLIICCKGNIHTA